MALPAHAAGAEAVGMDTAQMRLIAGAAELAPSIHNTQPWHFVAHADGAFEVYADPALQLRAIDPSGRQLMVSVGAAVEFARLAVRGLGYDCTVDVLPDPARPDLVARLVPTTQRSAEPAELALLDAMDRRHTDRGPYEDRPLPPLLLDELRTGVERYGLWLRQIDSAVDRVVVTAALSDAERRQAADAAYAEELRRWTARPGRGDGFAEPPAPWPDDRVSDVPLRDFSGRDEHRRPGPGTPPAVERDPLVLLGSVGDDAAAHVATGRALAWLLLRITVDGISGQPLGQALDAADSRIRMAHDLRLLGHPQFLLRLGYGRAVAQTARRRINDVLTVAG